MTDEVRARVDSLKENISTLKTVSDTIAEVGITIENKPTDMPSRPGYKWTPYQATAGGSITWVETESEDKSGTAEQPITFAEGMAVYPNYYYTDGTTRYVCIQGGNPESIGEGEYFTAF